MITLKPDDVRKLFGPLFTRNVLVMVDERAGMAEVLGQTGRGAKVPGSEFLDTNSRNRRIGAPGAVLLGIRDIKLAGLYGEHC